MTLTTFDGKPVDKPFAWSYSKLESYRTCPKQLYHKAIKKDFPEKQNDNMLWGNRVHDAMAKRIAHSTPLPEGMTQWEKWIDWALQNTDRDTILEVERKLAITNQLKSCDYFDRRVDPWFRAVGDVIKINGSAGRVIDWKTGKIKENSEQLALTAVVLFSHYEELEVVASNFVWLQDDLKSEEVFTRADIPNILQRVLPDVIALHRAEKTGDWPAKPSGLCKKHCGVLSCAYHGRGNG